LAQVYGVQATPQSIWYAAYSGYLPGAVRNGSDYRIPVNRLMNYIRPQ